MLYLYCCGVRCDGRSMRSSLKGNFRNVCYQVRTSKEILIKNTYTFLKKRLTWWLPAEWTDAVLFLIQPYFIGRASFARQNEARGSWWQEVHILHVNI